MKIDLIHVNVPIWHLLSKIFYSNFRDSNFEFVCRTLVLTL